MTLMRTPAKFQTITGDVVKIVTGYSYFNPPPFVFDVDVYSGVRFSSDGNMYAYQAEGGVTNIGSWLVSGTNSDFYLVSTINAGTLTVDEGRGPHQLNADADFYCLDTTPFGGAVTASVTFTIEDDATTDYAGPTTLSFSAMKETGL